jgi:hypothetical protein
VREGSLADNLSIGRDEADLMGLARPVTRIYSGHRNADQSLYWRSRRNSPLDWHRGEPAAARVPRYSWHRGKKSLS